MMRVGKISLILLWGALLGIVLLMACDNEKNRTYTIGVINISQDLEKSLAGFKAGMTQLGYIEGKNIRYIYGGAIQEINKLPTAAQALLAAKVDLILTITTPATLAAKQATSDSDLPVVFAIVTDPVGAGIVESMRAPGSNITGVTIGQQEMRRLEWLVRLAPEIRQIYIPFNPKDQSPVLALKMIRKAALKLGVRLITREVSNSEILEDAVLNIPAEADAIFILPDSYIGTRIADLAATAIKHNLPMSDANVTNVKSHSILTSFGMDQLFVGKQAARLADKILRGTRPADLPVEMAEFYLSVNLKVARAIGLIIPDEILAQADIIIR